ncbi:ABC transporter permease [Geobacillus sp. LEMMJ02]|nr:ABC transporter permease [Geobacillus sp. LEMMJ02]
MKFTRGDIVRNFRIIIIRLSSISIFLSAWHLLVYFNIKDPLYFNNIPSPIKVIDSWKDELLNPIYFKNISVSLYRVLTGIILAIFIGFPLGVLAGINKYIYNCVFAVTEIFRPIPLLAYVPIVAILFHGVEGSIIFVTFIGAFFPILVNVVEGMGKIPKRLVYIIEVNNGRFFDKLIKLYIPYITSALYTGTLVGVGASWMGVITAETLSGTFGIGYYTWNAYQTFQYEKVFIGMFTIGILGFFSSLIL